LFEPQQLDGKLSAPKLWNVACQEGEMLLGTPQRQNRVDAQHPSFAHMRTATQGSVNFFPFWWFKEKRE